MSTRVYTGSTLIQAADDEERMVGQCLQATLCTERMTIVKLQYVNGTPRAKGVPE